MAAKKKKAEPKKIGRPTLLTDALHAEILKNLRAGMSLRTAAESSGVGLSTIQRWIQHGGEADADPALVDFRDGTTRARAQGRHNLVLRVAGAAQNPEHVGDWRAAAWLLERLEPETYSLKQVLEHQGPAGGPVQAEVTVANELGTMTDQELDSVRKIRARARARARGDV